MTHKRLLRRFKVRKGDYQIMISKKNDSGRVVSYNWMTKETKINQTFRKRTILLALELLDYELAKKG